MSGSAFGPYAAMALVIGFGILEIVLLAGTAFAVGARRQTRELGLVMAAGGTPRDVRRIVLMQGCSPVWMLPSLVGKFAGLARMLPLSARMAVRDAARARRQPRS